MSALAPFRLEPTFAARTWGRHDLSPWYKPSDMPQIGEGADPVGEAWLTGPASKVADGEHRGDALGDVARQDGAALLGGMAAEGEFPLLLKLLFPDAKLSVQVHPNDAEAQELGLSRGKTECWYVLSAEPGATVACGLKPGVSVEQLEPAIADGSMEDLLQHLPVSKGDMIFVDAGTVHAIGPGATLLEVQQTCDVTYRLYDYGRPRELHLQQGLAVSKAATRAGKVAPEPVTIGSVQGTRLLKEQYFTVDSFTLAQGEQIELKDAAGKPHCFVALGGDAELSADGTAVRLPGSNAVVVPASAGAVTVKALGDVEIVRSMP